jgi:luciferase family oxidoreductase group 1
MSLRLPLGVLDLCKRTPRLSAQQALSETLELAGHAERLGYHRYWIAEHHTEDASQSSPEVVLPLLAARTHAMRIGAAGILLRYYSPLKVAELFLALEALFPGRIDLGIARGPGVLSPETAVALVDGNDAALTDQQYHRKVADLAAYLAGQPPAEPRFRAVRANPRGVTAPPIWMLGTGSDSLTAALRHGAHFAVSLFFRTENPDGPALFASYRQKFAASSGRGKPHTALAVSVICAESAAEAKRIDENLTARGYFATNVVGTPAHCRAQLEALARGYSPDELMLATWPAEFEARLRTYELIARAWSAR